LFKYQEKIIHRQQFFKCQIMQKEFHGYYYD
jgi:hypothetical protein